MKPFKPNLILILVIVILSACGPNAAATPLFQGYNPYTPQSGDSAMLTGDIQVDSASVLVATSQPPQVAVTFAYFQPTPCYKLRVEISKPDADKKINLKAYAVAEKDKPCALAPISKPLQANLNLGSFPSGHYSVVLNGSEIGQFDS